MPAVPAHSGAGNVFTTSTHIQTLDLSRTPLNMHVRRPEGAPRVSVHITNFRAKRKVAPDGSHFASLHTANVELNLECCSASVPKYDCV